MRAYFFFSFIWSLLVGSMLGWQQQGAYAKGNLLYPLGTSWPLYTYEGGINLLLTLTNRYHTIQGLNHLISLDVTYANIKSSGSREHHIVSVHAPSLYPLFQSLGRLLVYFHFSSLCHFLVTPFSALFFLNTMLHLT